MRVSIHFGDYYSPSFKFSNKNWALNFEQQNNLVPRAFNLNLSKSSCIKFTQNRNIFIRVNNVGDLGVILDFEIAVWLAHWCCNLELLECLATCWENRFVLLREDYFVGIWSPVSLNYFRARDSFFFWYHKKYA